MKTIEVPEDSNVIIINSDGTLDTKVYQQEDEQLAAPHTVLTAILLGFLADIENNPTEMDKACRRYLGHPGDFDDETDRA